MSWIFLILTLLALLLLARRLRRTRRLLHEAEAAVRARRRFLPETSVASLERLGMNGFVRELNNLIDHYIEHEAEEVLYSKQVEAMLRAVQEVVIVFDGERKVEFANRAAERLFHGGRSLKGLRLEGVMRSLSLLEMLAASEAGGATEPRQIQIEQESEVFWFEASCVPVRAEDDRSTLLVLHDITRLKELEVMRRDFVANVSHELRTPLTIIKGFAETLVEDDSGLDLETRKRFLNKIVNNADRLNLLVEDLLTLSRLESKPDQLDLNVHSLRALLEECLEDYRNRIDPANQVLQLSFDPGVGEFVFDRFRIHQVLDNLVENVFRYAPDFTKLEFVVERLDDPARVRCTVRDDGPGIPAKDRTHVFERFYRVDKGRSRERGGTGLGLSIVKHIIQLHGGSIHAESGEKRPATEKNPTPALEAHAPNPKTPPPQVRSGTAIVFTLPYRQKENIINEES